MVANCCKEQPRFPEFFESLNWLYTLMGMKFVN
jgi:hypothetical protein